MLKVSNLLQRLTLSYSADNSFPATFAIYFITVMKMVSEKKEERERERKGLGRSTAAAEASEAAFSTSKKF